MRKKKFSKILLLSQYCFLYAIFAQSGESGEVSTEDARVFAESNFEALNISISQSAAYKMIKCFVGLELIAMTRRESSPEIAGWGRPPKSFYHLTRKGKKMLQENLIAYSSLSFNPRPD